MLVPQNQTVVLPEGSCVAYCAQLLLSWHPIDWQVTEAPVNTLPFCRAQPRFNATCVVPFCELNVTWTQPPHCLTYCEECGFFEACHRRIGEYGECVSSPAAYMFFVFMVLSALICFCCTMHQHWRGCHWETRPVVTLEQPVMVREVIMTIRLDECCAICHEFWGAREDDNHLMKAERCEHVFHESCLRRWFQEDPRHLCPLCRR